MIKNPTMDFHEVFTGVVLRLRPYLLILVLGGIGLILIVYGLISLLTSSSASDGVIFESANEQSEQSGAIIVDVAGAVVKPGVYKLSADARIKDALVLAGGLSETADREWVAKSINLAERVTDETKIYIPSLKQSSSVLSTSDSKNWQININTASVSELDKLEGIGPVSAQKILDGRPYSKAEDLLTKKIIGEKVYSQIKDKITVY